MVAAGVTVIVDHTSSQLDGGGVFKVPECFWLLSREALLLSLSKMSSYYVCLNRKSENCV